MKKALIFLSLFAIALSLNAQKIQTCQDFEGFQINSNPNQQGWTTYNEAGSQEWVIKEENGNKFAEMTAQNGDTLEIDWLVSPKVTAPIDETVTVTFDSRDGFYNGDAVQLLVTDTYYGDPTSFYIYWVDISGYNGFASFDSNGMGISFVPSISAVSYTGSAIIPPLELTFAFKYTGGIDSISTIMQIDNFCYDIPASIDEKTLKLNTFYPNPAQDQMQINTTSNCELVEIYSISGQQVMSLDAQEQMNVNISSLNNGIYFIKFINTDGSSSTSKLVKN